MRHDLTVWHTGGCDGHDVEPVTSTVRTPHIMLREIKSIAENILLEDCLCAAAPEGRPRQGHDYHPCAEVPRVLKSAPRAVKKVAPIKPAWIQTHIVERFRDGP